MGNLDNFLPTLTTNHGTVTMDRHLMVVRDPQKLKGMDNGCFYPALKGILSHIDLIGVYKEGRYP
jgi:hypothetical protein